MKPPKKPDGAKFTSDERKRREYVLGGPPRALERKSILAQAVSSPSAKPADPIEMQFFSDVPAGNKLLSWEDVDYSIKQIYALDYKLPLAIRTYAEWKNDERPKNGSPPLTKDQKIALGTLIEEVGNSSSIFKINLHAIRKAGWEICEEMMKDEVIKNNIKQYHNPEMASKKRGILDSIAARIVAIDKAHHLTDKFTSPEELVKDSTAHADNIFIPLYKIFQRHSTLHQAMEQSIAEGRELSPDAVSRLTDDELKTVGAWNDALRSFGLELLAAPAANAWHHIIAGYEHAFGYAFYGVKPSDPEEIKKQTIPQLYASAEKDFSLALKALDSTEKQFLAEYKPLEHDLPDSILDEMTQFLSRLKMLKGQWQSDYSDQKGWQQQMGAALKKIKAPEREWAEELYKDYRPGSLGSEYDFGRMINEFEHVLSEFKQKFSVRSKGTGAIATDAAEISTLYSGLSLIRERINVTQNFADRVHERIRSLREPGHFPPTDELEGFIRIMERFCAAMTVGNRKTDGPQKVAGEADQILNKLNKEIDDVDRAVVIFKRLRKPLENLRAYAERHAGHSGRIANQITTGQSP